MIISLPPKDSPSYRTRLEHFLKKEVFHDGRSFVLEYDVIQRGYRVLWREGDPWLEERFLTEKDLTSIEDLL